MKPFGMVLITRPTGSGKSTTLYAMLMLIGRSAKILPTSQPLKNLSNTRFQGSTNRGCPIFHGLKALLRQDPDVIMVGEIRDKETAEIAVQAALVGRLLLSTLHTNDSIGSIPRLLDI